jgi:hypothetical protein
VSCDAVLSCVCAETLASVESENRALTRDRGVLIADATAALEERIKTIKRTVKVCWVCVRVCVCRLLEHPSFTHVLLSKGGGGGGVCFCPMTSRCPPTQEREEQIEFQRERANEIAREKGEVEADLEEAEMRNHQYEEDHGLTVSG